MLYRCFKNNTIKTQEVHTYLYFCIDETTVPRDKYVAKFIVGKLNVNSPSKPYPLASKVLQKTNNNTIAIFVNDSFRVLWSEGGNDEKVLLILSDITPYMVTAAKKLNCKIIKNYFAYFTILNAYKSGLYL